MKKLSAGTTANLIPLSPAEKEHLKELELKVKEVGIDDFDKEKKMDEFQKLHKRIEQHLTQKQPRKNRRI